METGLSIEGKSAAASRLCQAAGLSGRSPVRWTGMFHWLPQAEKVHLPDFAIKTLEGFVLIGLWLSAQVYLLMLYGSAAVILAGIFVSSTRWVLRLAAAASPHCLAPETSTARCWHRFSRSRRLRRFPNGSAGNEETL